MGDKVQLSGRLPGEEKNGLKAHDEVFLDVDAPEPMFALVQVERKSRQVDDDTDEVKVGVRITAIEVLEGEAADAAKEQLRVLREKRSGVVTLDIDGGER